MVFTVSNEKRNQDNTSQKSVDLPNELSAALGKFVNELSDAYSSGKGKDINIGVRFLIATSGTFIYTSLVVFTAPSLNQLWDPEIFDVVLVNFLFIAFIAISFFSIYLGFLITLTKFQYSYVRLFLAGVFLPAIVFTLIPWLS